MEAFQVVIDTAEGFLIAVEAASVEHLLSFFFLVKPSSYSRIQTYTDGRGDDGKTPRRRREGPRAQPRATRVQRTRAQAET